MCGIAGIVSPSGAYGRVNLEPMDEALSHRGPDASGFWQEDYVYFGHRRLSIIDLSLAANQPMISADGRLVIVFNGEIYNFKEIAGKLQMADPGIQFRTSSDTEVLLEAFRVWGVDFLERLNGMFAIAIYDRQEKEIYLFRDRIGIKPLYYIESDTDLFFASEIKSLLSLPFHKEVDIEALQDYLFLESVPGTRSIIQGIC